MSGGMSTMQEKMNHDHARLVNLENVVHNFTIDNDSFKVEDQSQPIIVSKDPSVLPGLVGRLTHVVQEYDQIISGLPHGKS